MKRISMVSVGVVSLMTVLGASAASVSATSSRVPRIGWKGTITMYAQGYTPAVPGIKLPPNSVHLTAFAQAAKQFEKLYPGIHIKFEDSNTWGSTQWYETEAAGGLLPDVTWVLGTTADTVLPQGIFTNLTPYFNQPNPYIPGNKKWKDIMNPQAMAMKQAPSGAQYIDDGDWLNTAFYFNKNLFKKAGILKPPSTWEQLLADCRKLKAHGITPGANRPHLGWFSVIFDANALGIKTLQRLQSYSPHSIGFINGVDQVKGYQAGFFNPAKNPRFTAWWPAMKKLYSYFDPNVLNESINGSLPAGAPTGTTLFLAGKVAMTFTGSWLPPKIKTLPKPQQFSVGAFNLSSLKGTSPYVTNLATAQDVGGPNGAWEYAISTKKADNSMTPQKFQAVLDWVRFFSTPTWNQKIVDQLGNSVPIFKGTVGTPGNRWIASGIGRPHFQVIPFTVLTPQANTSMSDLFQEYVTGHVSFAEAKQQYDSLAQQAIQQYAVQNHIS